MASANSRFRACTGTLEIFYKRKVLCQSVGASHPRKARGAEQYEESPYYRPLHLAYLGVLRSHVMAFSNTAQQPTMLYSNFPRSGVAYFPNASKRVRRIGDLLDKHSSGSIT
jgi:hypothetical protein